MLSPKPKLKCLVLHLNNKKAQFISDIKKRPALKAGLFFISQENYYLKFPAQSHQWNFIFIRHGKGESNQEAA